MDKEKTFLYVIIALITLLLCTTVSTCVYKYKYDRLVAEHRQQLELSRERAAVLTDTLTRAREEAGAIGESLSRQRTSVSELRELIGEIQTRYEKMEELLSSDGRCVSDSGGIDGGAGNTCGDEISEE